MNANTSDANTNSQTPGKPPGPDLVVGIDWADREHAVCFLDEHGQAHEHTLEHSTGAIDQWAADLARRFPGRPIAVALEQSKGALVHALRKYEHLVLYPINPKQLARYRESLYPGGGKSDPGDARLLAQFLKLHHDRLRPWRPDSAETRQLARLTEIRRKVVEERKRVALQLTSTLKEYFPLLLELFPGQKLHTLVPALVLRWPTLAKLKRAAPQTLRRFLKQHGVTHADTQTELIEAFRAAVPLTDDPAVVEPAGLYAPVLARQLEELVKAVRELDEKIAQLTRRHPDEKIFRSLPGAGDALVPRLIAAFGSDRDRFDSAEQLQCYSGIAPITRKSGKQMGVFSRFACPKFLKQTFHEFADHARKWSAWSRAFYQQKRAAGCKHHAAVRALAYKWIRIMFHLWKTKTTYDEKLYIEQLKQRGSQVVNFLETA